MFNGYAINRLCLDEHRNNERVRKKERKKARKYLHMSTVYFDTWTSTRGHMDKCCKPPCHRDHVVVSRC